MRPLSERLSEKSPVLGFIYNMAMSILTDPLTYISGEGVAGKTAKVAESGKVLNATKNITEEIAEKNAVQIGEKGLKETAEATGKEIPKVGKEFDTALKQGDEAVDALKGAERSGDLSKLTQEEINAINKYTGENYKNINDSLRGLDTLSTNNAQTVDILKSTLSKASLQKDMTLYRGTSTEGLGSLKNLSPEELIGEKFIEPGFMSTSTKNSVDKGTFSGNMPIKIEASKGVHALDISSISQYASESEILFNAGQKMLRTSAENKGGILYITVIPE